MRIKVFILLILFVSVSCKNYLKEFAQQADTVSLNVIVTGDAHVNLVEHNGNRSLAGFVMNTAVAAHASKESGILQERIKGLLVPDVVKQMIVEDATQRLSSPIPFMISGDETDGVLEIIVNNYGIEQHGGSPGFVIDYTMSVFSGITGENVYEKNFFCVDNSFYNVYSPGNIIGTATTISILRKMTDEQIKGSLQSVIERCTQKGLSAMRARATD